MEPLVSKKEAVASSAVVANMKAATPEVDNNSTPLPCTGMRESVMAVVAGMESSMTADMVIHMIAETALKETTEEEASVIEEPAWINNNME